MYCKAADHKKRAKCFDALKKSPAKAEKGKVGSQVTSKATVDPHQLSSLAAPPTSLVYHLKLVIRGGV